MIKITTYVSLSLNLLILNWPIQKLMKKMKNRNISLSEGIKIIVFNGAKSSKREKNYLSTISQDTEKIAVQSAKILVNTIKNKEI